MAKVADSQSSFAGGEYSALVQGNVEAERYAIGLAIAQNYVPILQGPVLRRPGTKYVAPTRTAGSSAPRLMPFEFSVTQAYIIELGNLYARFYRNNAAVLLATQDISNITQANPAVVTYVGADTYANGDEVEIAGVVGMTQVNGRRFTVANLNAGANTFELSGVNSAGYTAYSSGGTVAEVYEVTTPYLTADLFQIKFTQSADVLYLVHPVYAPRKLTRTGHTSWTLTAIDFLDGPYFPINATSTTLTLSATTGSVTVTASAVTGINGGAGFAATDIGRLIRWKDAAGNWTWLQITAWTSTTVVTATIRGADASATTATVNWRLGLWSDTTGYPAAVDFFGDRLWFGGSTSAPQRIDGSCVGDYENFRPSNPTGGVVGDSDAVSFTLNATDVNVIRWLRADERGLLVGTVGAEWLVRPSTQGEAITPTNINAKPSTKHGSANIDPVRAGKATLFVQRAKRKLRELISLDEEIFSAPDLTQLAEHVTRGGLVQLTYQQEPYSIVWACRADGTLLSMTYERGIERLNVGWARHVLGGIGTVGGGQPVVESVAVIPSPDGTRDELWVVVKRYIGGQTKHYVEYVTKFFDDATDAEDQFFVDCGITYDGAAATVIGGLWHLEGQTVSVLADAAVLPAEVVANGQVTIDEEASVVQLGYAYNSDGQRLRPNVGAADGTSMGKTKRTHRAAFFFYRSGGFKFGRDFDNLNTLIFRRTSDPIGAAVPLFTGIKSEPFDGGYDMDNQMVWRQDQPLNGTLLAVYPQTVTQDR